MLQLQVLSSRFFLDDGSPTSNAFPLHFLPFLPFLPLLVNGSGTVIRGIAPPAARTINNEYRQPPSNMALAEHLKEAAQSDGRTL